MKQFTYTITDPVGIHARPAGLLVKAAKSFSSAITLEAGGRSAGATKLMALMSMGIKQGDAVTVTLGEGGFTARVERPFGKERKHGGKTEL